MIVCRPNTGERRLLIEGQLDIVEGLLGDNWRARGSTSTPDSSANPDAQITIMNSRAATLVLQDFLNQKLPPPAEAPPEIHD